MLNDSFSAADGTLLTAHTAPSGHSWGINPLSSGVARIDDGRVHGTNVVYAYSSAADADCEIEAVVRCHTVDGQFAGILGRMSTTSASWYALLLNGGVTLYSSTSLGNFPFTPTPGSDYRLKLSMQGTLIRGFIDGCEAALAIDAAVTAGRIGVAFQGATSASTGMHIDSLSVTAESTVSQVLFQGDSLTAGTGVSVLSHAERFPTRVMSLLNRGWDWANRGVGGQTLATMLANISKIDLCRRPAADANVVVVWGGVNDFGAGATVQNVIDRLTSYGNGRRALGFKVVVLTLIAADPAHAGVSDDFESQRTAVNSWLRTNWSTHFDALADIAADSRLSDPFNTTYFQADHLHLTAAGANVVAEIVAGAIEALDTPTITITAPAADDILLTGQAAAIRWQSTGAVPQVDVRLSRDGGATYEGVLATAIDNTGELEWTPTVEQLTPQARVKVATPDDSVTAESDEFLIATTAQSGEGVTAFELAAALEELRAHGDTVWGRNPILPLIARVNTDPVSKTTLIAYQRGRSRHQLMVVDATGEGVSLAGKSLQFCLETLTGGTVGSTEEITVTGEDFHIASFSAESSWHEKPGLYRYAMRDLEDGGRVWARGDYVIEPTAGPAA